MKSLHPLIPLAVGSLSLSGWSAAQTLDSGELLHTRPTFQTSTTLADLDADGDLDWVALWSDESAIVWAENLGPDGFGATRHLIREVQSSLSATIEVADLDGDGDPDFLITRSSIQNPIPLGWYENVGGLQYGALQPIPVPISSATQGQAADIDGDGDLDVVLAANREDPAWVENQGVGAWGPIQFVGSTVFEVRDLEIADFDGNGWLDMVWADSTGSDLYWAPNLGGGTFGPAELISTLVDTPYDIELHDLDSDADLDLVVASTNGESVEWFQNLGNGNLAPRATLASGFGRPVRLRVADWDADGDQDLAVGCNEQPWLVHLENQGMTQFGPPVPMGTGPWQWGEVFALDVRQDGLLDVVVATGELLWSENLGSGWAQAAPLPARVSEGSPVDWDGDGDLDLLGLDLDTESVTLQLNDGNGHFSAPILLLSGWPLLTDAELFDADGDGDLDLMTAAGSFQSATSRVDWHENVQGVMVQRDQVYTAWADSGTSLIRADMEGDGDDDFVVQHQTVFSSWFWDATWVRNDGNGQFQSMSTLVLERNDPVRVAELNGDGELDFLVRSRVNNDFVLQWSDNFGGGAMSPPIPIQSYPNLSLRDYDPVDFDGDGDIDIVTSDHVGPVLGWIENLGSSQFAPQVPRATPAVAAQVIRARDMDLDGDLDWIAMAANEGEVFLNQGTGTFGPGLPFQHRSTTWPDFAVHFADMDADGDLDLLKETGLGTALHRNEWRFGEGYCQPTSTHSGGQFGKLYAQGSPKTALNQFALIAYDLPLQQFGFFLVADQPGLLIQPGTSQGNLCVGGAIGRMNRTIAEIFLTGMSGTGTVPLDLLDVPTPLGPTTLQAGQTSYFQAWYRDANPFSTSNFTEGLKVRWE